MLWTSRLHHTGGLARSGFPVTSAINFEDTKVATAIYLWYSFPPAIVKAATW